MHTINDVLPLHIKVILYATPADEKQFAYCSVYLNQLLTRCMQKWRMVTAKGRPTRMPWARWPTDCTASST